MGVDGPKLGTGCMGCICSCATLFCCFLIFLALLGALVIAPTQTVAFYSNKSTCTITEQGACPPGYCFFSGVTFSNFFKHFRITLPTLELVIHFTML